MRSTLIVLTLDPVGPTLLDPRAQSRRRDFQPDVPWRPRARNRYLVDNALVEIENIKRHIASGKSVRDAIVEGARQVAFPEFVSTTGICIVFLPIFLPTGTAAFVFKPLALAVIFAMIASYLLSRTLVPTLASLILPAELRAEHANDGQPPRGLSRIHHAIEHGLEFASGRQRAVLHRLVQQRWIIPVVILIVAVIGLLAGRSLGASFSGHGCRADAALRAFAGRHPARRNGSPTAPTSSARSAPPFRRKNSSSSSKTSAPPR